MIELERVTAVFARLIEGGRDDRLTAPTPCRDARSDRLLDHVDGLSMEFTAATRTRLPGDQTPADHRDRHRANRHDQLTEGSKHDSSRPLRTGSIR